jgi:hypothetical protein
MPQNSRDGRVYLATRSVRHIAIVHGRSWVSLCNGPEFEPLRNVVLFGSALMAGPLSRDWKKPVCKYCIRNAFIAYSAAADLPSRS